MAEQATARTTSRRGPTYWDIFSRGLLAQNPSLRQMLGLCPTLAVTTAVTNGLGMGLATTFVLVCSEIVVSLLRKVIPSSVRIPAFITVIASFVTITMMLVKAYLPALDESLGLYLPLIVVNCIVLGRAETFASKNGPARSAFDGLGMGVGFTIALVLISAVRELLGAGTLLGTPVLPSFIEPMIIMVTPAGGFAVFGVLVALSLWVEGRNKEARRQDSESPSPSLCAACPINCNLNNPADEECTREDITERLVAAFESAYLPTPVEQGPKKNASEKDVPSSAAKASATPAADRPQETAVVTPAADKPAPAAPSKASTTVASVPTAISASVPKAKPADADKPADSASTGSANAGTPADSASTNTADSATPASDSPTTSTEPGTPTDAAKPANSTTEERDA